MQLNTTALYILNTLTAPPIYIYERGKSNKKGIKKTHKLIEEKYEQYSNQKFVENKVNDSNNKIFT